jgi:Anthranilate synthase component I, N terminal region
MIRMRKRIYHYEVELMENFFDKLGTILLESPHYMVLKQEIDIYNYTYIGLKPKEYMYTDHNYLNIINHTQTLNKRGDYLKVLVDWLNKTDVEYKKGIAPFIGGAMGFISDTIYDYYHNQTLDYNFPHICFMVFDELLIVDHNRNKLIFTYIGDYDKGSLYNNKFINLKLKIEKSPRVLNQSYSYEIHVNENSMKEKYQKITQKLEDEKQFLFKTSEQFEVDTNLDSYQFFNIIKNHHKQVALFKTNGFSMVAYNDHDFFYYKGEDLTIGIGCHQQLNSLKDLMLNQAARLTGIEMLDVRDEYHRLEVDNHYSCSNLYEFFMNWKLMESNYGIPFDRVFRYARRYEAEKRVNGLIGYVGYHHNTFLLNMKTVCQFTDNKTLLNQPFEIHNDLTEYEYINHINYYINELKIKVKK